MTDCLNWLFAFFVNMLSLLDNTFVITGVSIVGILIGAYVLYMIVDRFYPKG